MSDAMSVQRYTPIVDVATDNPMSLKYMYPHSGGQYVTYDDHVAALAEAEQRGYVAGVERENRAFGYAYQQGRAEALREAREAVDYFHVGSCRWYYVERRCTCGLHDAIDALITKGASDD